MHVVTTHRRVQPVSLGLLACGGAVVAMSVTGVWGAPGAVIVLALGIAACAAVVDMRTGRLPNRLVGLAAVPTLAVAGVAFGNGRGLEAVSSVVLGALAFAGPMFVVHLVSPSAIGFGDVKLAAALGVTLGLIEPALGLLALCIASAVTALVGLLGRHKTLAFGPGLVAGAIAALLIAAQLGEGALQWQ